MLLTSCSSMKAKDFNNKLPRFILEDFFSGSTYGQGIFFDRFKNAKLSFKVELAGVFKNNILILNETLTYDSGEVVKRSFDIEKISDNEYKLTGSDVVGVGKIEAYGNVLRWDYRLKQQIGSNQWILSFDDWMFLQSDEQVLNRATATKLGFELGEVFMVVKKEKGNIPNT